MSTNINAMLQGTTDAHVQDGPITLYHSNGRFVQEYSLDNNVLTSCGPRRLVVPGRKPRKRASAEDGLYDPKSNPILNGPTPLFPEEPGVFMSRLEACDQGLRILDEREVFVTVPC